MIKFVQGDLFENEYNAQALAHGVNCQGVMGAGIAKRFKNDYPKMYLKYQYICRNEVLTPGKCFLWGYGSGETRVFNLATQEYYGKKGRASYDWIRSSLSMMKKQADKYDIESIAIPKIGCGLGGLEWGKVKEIIEEVFTDWEGILYVYEKTNQ